MIRAPMPARPVYDAITSASNPPYSMLDWPRTTPDARHSMTNRTTRFLFAAVFAVLAATQAYAHPHVFVTMKSEIVYGADGAVTAVRHAWTFDDMFSTYALQGLESKKKGEFTREELAPLAEVNVTSLKEYDYFTEAKIDGKKVEFTGATDYWLEFKDSVLVLHFTLPLKSPVKSHAASFEIYDPSYFIDFSFEDKDPVKLSGTPGACKLDVSKPGDTASPQGKRLSESFFANPNSSNFGAQFANKIAVKCP
jgi:ABC-type uncharacterized transport system substrate-binding protein